MKLPEKAELLPPLPLNDSHRTCCSLFPQLDGMLIFDISELPFFQKERAIKL